MPNILSRIPDNVPPHLIIDFDFNEPPGIHDGDVYDAWHRLHNGPDIVWTPHYGGHWILTRGEDIRAIQNDHEHFSHKDFNLPRNSKPMRLPPLELDPPEHAAYRTLINPFFAPRAVVQLEQSARTLAAQIIDELSPKGRCEFVADFSRILPVSVFLNLMDLPLSMRDTFIGWAEEGNRVSTPEKRMAAFGKVISYLKGVIAERETARGDDFISRILDARDAGRITDPTDDIGIVTLLFFGGMDTVANMMSFSTRFLASSPQHQRRIQQEPAIIPKAVEEFLRRFGLSNTVRTLTQDYEYKGVLFKYDDAVMVPISMSSMDDRLYKNPLQIDFHRDASGHNTFGNGPHRCVGLHLARAEMRIFSRSGLRKFRRSR